MGGVSEEDAASPEQGQGASGEAETLGEKAEILSFMRIFVKEHSALHFKNISKSRSSMSIEEHSS